MAGKSINDILFRFLGDTKSLDRATRKGQRDLRATDKSVSRTQQAMGGLRSTVGKLGVAFGAMQAGRFAADAIQLASAADEVDSKFEAVFGSNEKLIDSLREWGDVAGVTESDAKDLAATFGNLAIAQGVGADEAADLSVEVATLAGDMASFNDSDPAQVFEDINKAMLTTEREGMKKYGIAVSEAEVKTRAMELAVADGRDEVTQADRAMASYEIITRQAGAAVGDLERTQDSAANQQRQLTASIEEAKTEIGRGLMPAYEAFLETSAKLVPVLGDVVSVVVDAGNATSEFGTELRRSEAPLDQFAGGITKIATSFLPGVLEEFKRQLIKLPWEDVARDTDDAADAIEQVTNNIGRQQNILTPYQEALGLTASEAYNLAAAEEAAAAEADAAASAWDRWVATVNSRKFDADKVRAGRTATRFVSGADQRFASGGMVAGQSGQASLAVVHGGERILTPAQQRAGGGGGQVVVNFNGVVGDPVAVAQQITDLLELADRTGG